MRLENISDLLPFLSLPEGIPFGCFLFAAEFFFGKVKSVFENWSWGKGGDIWTCSPTDQFQQLLPGVGPVTVRWALEVKLLVLREGGTVTAQCSAPL